MINIICLYQLYKRRKIAEVKWIDRDSNPTDAITKSKPLSAFKWLINTNQIKLKTVEWVERTTLVTQLIKTWAWQREYI
jgi:hypothetical protein